MCSCMINRRASIFYSKGGVCLRVEKEVEYQGTLPIFHKHPSRISNDSDPP